MKLNWHSLPFVRLLIPILLGIAIATYANIDSALLQFLLAGSFLLLLLMMSIKSFRNHRYLVGYSITLLFFLLGLGRASFQAPTHHPLALSTADAEQYAIGTIASDPVLKNTLRFEMNVHSIGKSLDSLNRANEKILAYLRTTDTTAIYRIGDKVAIKGVIRDVPPPANPHQFNYQRYLYFNNIRYQSFVDTSDWNIVPATSPPFLRRIQRIRHTALAILQQHLKDDQAYAVGTALILGYKDAITDEIQQAYADTGAMHVLAVSGLHVGIIAIILQWILKLLPFKRFSRVGNFIKLGLNILGIWFFAIVTGLSPSVVRAAVMFSFVMVGIYLNRKSSIYNTLAIAAFFTLMYNPYLLFHVGFQLSYAAVLGIVYFQPKLYKLIYTKNKILDYIWQLITVSIAAQLTTLPLSLYYFHQFPTFFWLSGLVVIPAALFILSLGLLVLFTAWLPPINDFLGLLLEKIIQGVNYLIFAIQDLPMGKFDGIWINTFVMVAFYGIIICLAAIIGSNRLKRTKWLVGGLSLGVFIAANTAIGAFIIQQQQEIVVYQIYKHTAIHFANGSEALLLTNESIPPTSLSFSTENNRMALGIKHEKHLILTDSTHSDFFFYKNGIGQFIDKRFAILYDKLPATNQKIKVDYLFICQNPRISIEDVLNTYDVNTIYIDGSNSKWKVNKWKEALDDLDLKYIDTSVEGGVSISIKK